MKKPFAVPTVALIGLMALGTAACGSSGSTKAASTSTTVNTKAPFCSANVTIDKAAAKATSGADFLAVLKANPTQLDALSVDAPSGKVGSEAKALVSFAQNAIATNNANAFDSPPASLKTAGSDIDTYCGVDGNGDALPADFGAGKTTAFCSVNDQINAGTNNAPDVAAALTFLKNHQSLVTQFVADIPSLPKSLQPDAQSLASTARSAIASNNPAAIDTPAVQKESGNIDLYCGHNQ